MVLAIISPPSQYGGDFKGSFMKSKKPNLKTAMSKVMKNDKKEDGRGMLAMLKKGMNKKASKKGKK